MPPAFVQSKGGTSNTLNSLGIAFTSNNTAGNLLVCSGVVNVSALAGLTITDTQGNTWTIALVDNWKALNTFFMAYAPNCKAGANTVTIAQLGSLISGAISEYSGVSTTAPLDVTGFSDSGAGTWTSATSGNVTTRENGELIVSAQGNATGPASVTLGSGFTNLQNDSGNFVSIESQVQATAGAIAGTFTISASSGACGVLTFVPPTDALPFNVWTPKGNVVANAGGTTFTNPNVRYDINPVILLGNTHVFKMWCGGNNAGTRTINYFESLDGLTSWTPYSGNPILTGAGATDPKIFINAGTYYLYIGDPTIAAYTATDGVTFTLRNANAVVVGGAGTWDSSVVSQLAVADQIAGTWYGLYAGNGTGNLDTQGVVTSTDLIHWVKYVGNPVVSTVTTNFDIHKVPGGYVAYSDGLYNNAVITAMASTGIFRFSASNVLGPWTELTVSGNPVAVYYSATVADFPGQATSNLGMSPGDPSLVEANGNVYLYYTIGRGFNVQTGINAALATGTTIAALQSTYEGVVGAPISGAPQLNLVTLGSDPGTGANANPIGGNWTPIATAGGTNVAQRLSNLIQGTTLAGSADSYWNAASFPADQWASVIAAVTSTNGFIGPEVRMNTSGAWTQYHTQWGGGNLGTGQQFFIAKKIAGASTTLFDSLSTNLTVNVGDNLMLAVNGTTLLAYYDGICIAAVVDGSIASGAAGFELFNNSVVANAAIASWSGGTFQDAPALQASISGNAGVGGATVAYSGTSSGSVTADSFGNYLLSNLPDGSYTITPSLSGYTFSPASASETLNGTNITGVNFAATKVLPKGGSGEQRFGFGFNFKF